MAAAFHSSDLQWQLLRTSHSFLVKRGNAGHVFSAEPLNVTNTHSYKFSGLANAKAVGVQLTADRKRVQLAVRNGKKGFAARPTKAVAKTQLGKHLRAGSSRGARTIRALTEKSFVRPDLTRFAITRYHKLRQATTGVASKKAARRSSRKTVA